MSGIDWKRIEPHLAGRLERQLAGIDLQPKNELSMEDAKARLRSTVPGRRDEHGEAEGVVRRPDDLQDADASAKLIVMDIGGMIERRYPGYQWMIQYQRFGRMLNIFNFHLHDQYGYSVRMVDVMNDPERKAAVNGAGELLERFGLPRGPMDPQKLAELLRDEQGKAIPDISDFENLKEKRKIEFKRKLATGEYQLFDVGGRKILRVDNGIADRNR